MNNELIERFLSGNLSEREQIEIENQLQTDKAFADDVAFILATKQSLHTDFAEKKKNEWKNLYQKNKKKTFTFSKSLVYMGSIAAAACLVFVLYQTLFTPSLTSQDYVASYISDNYTTLSTQMGGQEDSLSSAVALYNNQQFEEALTTLNRLEETPKVIEYKGLTELQLSNYLAALSDFQKLENIEDSVVKKAPLYQAITLIELKRETEAKDILEKIVGNPNYFGQKEAKDILKLL